MRRPCGITLSVSIRRRGARGQDLFHQRNEKHRGDEADHDGEEGIGKCLGLRFSESQRPELVERRWYMNLLHNHRSTVLKGLLLFQGDQRITVINIPWYLTR